MERHGSKSGMNESRMSNMSGKSKTFKTQDAP